MSAGAECVSLQLLWARSVVVLGSGGDLQERGMFLVCV